MPLDRVYDKVQAADDRRIDRRTRKRLANRQLISDAATRLFMEHGFDQVTVDQIAEAADVGRMTVFNHFPRKEDMFFDREQDAHDLASATIHDRSKGVSPIEALRLLAHRMVEERHPLLPIFIAPQRFVATALASEALKARARQMQSVFERELARMMASAVRRPANDAEARLLAGLLVATWSAAFIHGHEAIVRTGDEAEASLTFLRLIDQGTNAVIAAAAGSPYTAVDDHRLNL